MAHVRIVVQLVYQLVAHVHRHVLLIVHQLVLEVAELNVLANVKMLVQASVEDVQLHVEQLVQVVAVEDAAAHVVVLVKVAVLDVQVLVLMNALINVLTLVQEDVDQPAVEAVEISVQALVKEHVIPLVALLVLV